MILFKSTTPLFEYAPAKEWLEFHEGGALGIGSNMIQVGVASRWYIKIMGKVYPITKLKVVYAKY